MKELLEYILKSICNSPDKITINEEEENEVIIYKIGADPQDIGKIIGKGGKIIKAIRTLIRTRAMIDNKKVQLILED